MDEEEAIVLSAYETANGMRRPGMNTNQLNLEADERVVHLYLTTFDHMNTRHVRFASILSQMRQFLLYYSIKKSIVNSLTIDF